MNPQTTPDPMAGYSQFTQAYNGPKFAIDGALPAATPAQTTLPATHSAGGVLGFLERNAQNIGGVAGGLLGELVDPLGGGVAGAALGSGIGQEIKNKTTGTNTNPFEEAAIGGASELGGQLLGRGVSKVVGGAADAADKMGINLLKKTGGSLDKRTAQAYDLDSTTRTMSDLGIKPNEYEDVANKFTGRVNDEPIGVNKIVERGISQAGNVDTTGIKDMAAHLMGQDTRITDPRAEQKAQGVIGGIIDKLNGIEDINAKPLTKSSASTDVLNKGADPLETLKAIRTLRSKADDLVGKGKNPLNITSQDHGIALIYHQTAQELEDRLYQDGKITLPGGKVIQGAGADNVVANGLVNKDDLDALKDIRPGDAKWAQHIDETVGKAKTIADLRSAQAPFVNAKNIARAKAASEATAGTSVTNSLRNVADVGSTLAGVAGAHATGGLSLALPALEMAENTNAGKQALGSGLRFAGKKIAGTTDKLTNPTSLPGKVANKVMDVNNKSIQQNTGNALVGAPNNNSGQPAGGVSDLVSSSIDSTMAPLNAAKNGTNSTTNMPTLAQILQAGGTQGLSAYLAYQRQETPELTQTQQDDWTKAQDAINAVKDFSKMFDQVKASGAVAGGLEELGTKIPGIQNTKSESALKAYESNAGDLASTLAQVLGGGKGSKALLTELKTELPDVNDSPQAAAMKLNVMVQRLGQHMGTILSAPATNTPGQLTNFSGMTVPGTVGISQYSPPSLDAFSQ